MFIVMDLYRTTFGAESDIDRLESRQTVLCALARIAQKYKDEQDRVDSVIESDPKVVDARGRFNPNWHSVAPNIAPTSNVKLVEVKHGDVIDRGAV